MTRLSVHDAVCFMLLLSTDCLFLFNINLFNISFSNTIRETNGLDLDLCPNCLQNSQRTATFAASGQRVNRIFKNA